MLHVSSNKIPAEVVEYPFQTKCESTKVVMMKLEQAEVPSSRKVDNNGDNIICAIFFE